MLKSIQSPQKYFVAGALLASGVFLASNMAFNLGYNNFAWLFFGFSWIAFSYFQWKAQK